MKWQTLSASVIGSNHQRGQLPCQDAHGVRVLSDEAVIIAVADGLGSAAWAEQGAQMAVTTALATLESALADHASAQSASWTDIVPAAFGAAYTALEHQAQATNRPLRDYATTLIVAALTPAGISVGQVGDGGVVVQFADGQLRTLSSPQRGEFANETLPLTAPDALTAVCYTNWAAPVQALAVFTDGLQQLCLEATTYSPYAPFFQPLFCQLQTPLDNAEAEQALLDFLQSERISKRTDDDRTLVLVGQIMAQEKLELVA